MSVLAQCPRCGHRLTPRQQPLTQRQAELLAFLRTYIAEKGYAPTFTEIAAAHGFTSLSTVHEHLKNLVRKGHITRTHRAERGIALVDVTAVVIS